MPQRLVARRVGAVLQEQHTDVSVTVAEIVTPAVTGRRHVVVRPHAAGRSARADGLCEFRDRG